MNDSSELLSQCLRRIQETDGEIHAWAAVAPQPATGDGLLRGIPIGVKDIIETRGLPTQYGSPLYAGRKSTEDAAVVAQLRSQGAIVLGKTHTCAFASFDPAPTRNPRLPGHTPGGSSAGSAAAVAAGMVPFALGTQTLGSVLRPASYCGVCGFKPSFGLLPFEGILPFAPSLDTVGFFSATAGKMEWFWSRAYGGISDLELRRPAYFRLPAEPFMTEAIDDAIARLGAHGIAVTELDLPAGWDSLVAAARTVNDYEGARSHEARYREFGEQLGARLCELIRRGLAMPEEEYEAALDQVERVRREVSSVFWEYPAILSAAATGPAPEGFEYTGDPSNNAPWTAVGLPSLSLPLKYGAAPLGLQITGALGRDDAVISVGAHAEKLLENR